jgi:prolipoprotein diacylglyceryltransferase
MEFRLLGAALVAFGCVAGVIALSSRGDPKTRRSDTDVALGAILAGVAAGRVVAMILGGTNPIMRPADLLIVRGGVDTAAASLTAGLAVVLITRRSAPMAMCRLAPAALAGLAGWHGACLIRGACLGTPSTLPWALAEPGSAITRHPVEIYTALLLAGGIVAVVVAYRRIGSASTTVGLAIALAGFARLATEPMRPVIGGSLAWLYAVALVAGVAVALLGRRLDRAFALPPPVHS